MGESSCSLAVSAALSRKTQSPAVPKGGTPAGLVRSLEMRAQNVTNNSDFLTYKRFEPSISDNFIALSEFCDLC